MSDETRLDTGAPAATAERRPASVTLRRTGDTDTEQGLMDPAHKALADALRFTYMLVRGAMVVLAVLYLFSGVQRVRTGQSGIALRFGNIVAADLEPGAHFSWPHPVGELIKVDIGNQSIDLDDEFFPMLSDADKRALLQEGIGGLSQFSGELDPTMDGYVLTADGSIGHTQWQVTYQRSRPTELVRNITWEDEARIIRGVVMQAIVHAAASMTIDEIYRGTADPSRPAGSFLSIEERARQMAQQTLDRLDTGVRIEALALTNRMPPRPLINDFNSVTQANEEAGKARAEATAERDAQLTGTAGGAAPVILSLIERYEQALAAGDRPAAAGAQAAINGLLLGETVQIDGTPVAASVGGSVASILQEANDYRSSMVSRARTDALTFQAKLANFNANPKVLIHSDWAEAFGAFLANPSIQMMFVPPGSERVVLNLNRDPEIVNRISREERAARGQAARERRQREQEESRFRRSMDQ